MDHTYVDAKNIKSLEDLIGNLVYEFATLRTLEATQLRALEIGILSDDQLEIAGHINGFLRALQQLYLKQAASIEKQLPPEFSIEEVNKKLSAGHIKKARQLARKKLDE